MPQKSVPKSITWMGSSLDDIKDDQIFTEVARKEAGHQLHRVQCGLDPVDWKPFETAGKGTREIRIKLDDGTYRVLYVAKFEETIYVLHCFQKKSQKTSTPDKAKALECYKAVQRLRLEAKREKKR